MGRAYRYFSDREFSSYHIISRTSRGEFLIEVIEKLRAIHES